MSVKCGNRKRHGDEVVYHDTAALVRACYQGEASAWDDVPRSMPDAAEPVKEVALQASQGGWKRGEPLPFAPGRYAILGGPMSRNVISFYKVDAPTEGRWAGYVFVKVQASDELHNVRDWSEQRRIINEIAKDPQEAMLRYGRELGHCGHCGRTLTNDESRARGIGPICAGKMGW